MAFWDNLQILEQICLFYRKLVLIFERVCMILYVHMEKFQSTNLCALGYVYFLGLIRQILAKWRL